MTHIDFYILSKQSRNGKEKFACRLAEKVFNLGHNIYLHTESQAHAALMDDLLWTFKPGSFLPHAFYGDDMGQASKILIGYDSEPNCTMDVLINLTNNVPLFFGRFERVSELVSQDNDNKNFGRERYSFYRDRGYTLKTHNLPG